MTIMAIASLASSVAGQFGAASSARRAADNRATALKAQASRRLDQGKMLSEQKLLEGGMNQTSYASDFISRGGDRRFLTADNLSLTELANRAKFESDQALADAQLESDMILSDATDIVRQSRDAQKSAFLSSFGSIMQSGSSYLQGKYGKNTY